MSNLRTVQLNTNYPAGAGLYDSYAQGAAQDVTLSDGSTLNGNFLVQLLHNENAGENPGLELVGNTSLGPTHATGLFQFEPGTASQFETTDGQPFDATNPFQSIDAAAIYLGDLVNKFLGKGYSSQQAYLKAANSFGDTASNNPAAQRFASKLTASLNLPQTVGLGLSGIAAAVTGQTVGGVSAAQGISAIGAVPGATGTGFAAIGAATTGQTVGGVTPQAAQAAIAATAASVNPFAGIAAALGSILTPAFAERAALVILGLLLIGAAVVALSRPQGVNIAALAAA